MVLVFAIDTEYTVLYLIKWMTSKIMVDTKDYTKILDVIWKFNNSFFKQDQRNQRSVLLLFTAIIAWVLASLNLKLFILYSIAKIVCVIKFYYVLIGESYFGRRLTFLTCCVIIILKRLNVENFAHFICCLYLAIFIFYGVF